MPDAADVVYVYDGSFEGLLCCVHESFYAREMPIDILSEDALQPSLFAQRYIETDEQKAARVFDSIPQKICPEAAELVQTVFLSCAANKEIKILQFLRLAYQRGAAVMHLLAHPVVQPMLAAEQHLRGEAHLLLGFVRFSEYDGALVSTISPKNFILPFIKHHFCTRFMGEQFLIYDRTHHAALVHQNRKAKIISLDALTLPPADETEQEFRELWKSFYKTIAITARQNERCRMAHCPKRYWDEMLEMRENSLLPDAPVQAKLSASPPAFLRG